MRVRITTSIVAGLLAGVVFGILMQMMTAPTPDGGAMPMMGMVAQVVRSNDLAIGWLYHLFNSAVIGAIFGWLLGARVQTMSAGLAWGLLYGFAWWILGGQILMPVLLGMSAFATLITPAMLPVAVGSLMGHLIYGLILGVAFVWLTRQYTAALAAQRGTR